MSRNNTIIFAGFFSAFTLTASSALFHFLHDNFDRPQNSEILKEIQTAEQETTTVLTAQGEKVQHMGQQSVSSDQNIPLLKANVPDAGAQAELPRIQYPISIRGNELDPHSDYLNSLATSGFFKTPQRERASQEQDGQRPAVEKIQSEIRDVPKNSETVKQPRPERSLSAKEVTGSLQDNNKAKKKSADFAGANDKKEGSPATVEQGSSIEPVSSFKTFNFTPN